MTDDIEGLTERVQIALAGHRTDLAEDVTTELRRQAKRIADLEAGLRGCLGQLEMAERFAGLRFPEDIATARFLLSETTP